MKQIDVLPSPNPLDATGIVSWVRIGDLHGTTATQNSLGGLRQIIDPLIIRFAAHLTFALLGLQRGPNKDGRK